MVTSVTDNICMTGFKQKIRQLAPHWAAMFVLMILLVVIGESIIGSLSVWQSTALIITTAVAYPVVVRYLGVAPETWQTD